MWDSNWYNPYIIRIYTTRSAGTSNYTIHNNKVLGAQLSSNGATLLQQSGTRYLTSKTHESNHAYHYTKTYPFKTDFSNAAVLNELNFFQGVPVSRSYAFLPDKIESSTIDKDGNGTITSSGNYTIKQHFTYNSYGFVASRFDEDMPGMVTTFIYSK